VLADGFESGSFGAWSSVTVEGDATAAVTWPGARTGNCAGRLVITTDYTSRANITRTLPAGTTEVWADGWFRVDGEGLSNSNVGFFRFFDGESRILDIYRQNITGELWIRFPKGQGWDYRKMGPVLDLGRWYEVKIYARIAGTSSQVGVWLDGSQLYDATVNVPASRLTSVLLGSEHQRQAMDLRFDDIVLHAR
jgi:hypothetical protein